MTVRPAQASEAIDIADLYLASVRSQLPYLPVVHTDDEVRDFYVRSVLPSSTVLVAEADGRIDGFAAFTPGRLDHLYVGPGHLRSGIGSALLEEVKRLSPEGFRLFVFQRNTAARTFYRRHGLSVVAFGSGDANEEHEPDVTMEWSGRVGDGLVR